MLDIAVLRRKAREAGERPILVSASAFAQIVAEIEAGRAAHARRGQTFGRRGKTL